MITYQGIPKPSFHAYRMLQQLGDEILERSEGVIVTRSRSDGRLAALVYHYPAEEPRSAPASFDSRTVAEATLAKGLPRDIDITFSALRPNVSFVIETLDRDHGNALAAWQALGCPEPMTREQTEIVRQAAHAVGRQTVVADETGTLRIRRTLSPWSVVSVCEQPASPIDAA